MAIDRSAHILVHVDTILPAMRCSLLMTLAVVLIATGLHASDADYLNGFPDKAAVELGLVDHDPFKEATRRSATYSYYAHVIALIAQGRSDTALWPEELAKREKYRRWMEAERTNYLDGAEAIREGRVPRWQEETHWATEMKRLRGSGQVAEEAMALLTPEALAYAKSRLSDRKLKLNEQRKAEQLDRKQGRQSYKLLFGAIGAGIGSLFMLLAVRLWSKSKETNERVAREAFERTNQHGTVVYESFDQYKAAQQSGYWAGRKAWLGVVLFFFGLLVFFLGCGNIKDIFDRS